jgi:hypothetical protein
MPPMRTTLVLMLALVACGGDDKETPDAATPPPPDAARPVLPLTAQAYCDTIQATCTGTVQQYPNATQCLATAAAFTMGASSTEMTGDTLGCRIYHAQNAMITMDTATHCPHAGPIGAKVDAATGQCGATPCDDFCALDTKLCGTDAAPVTGVTNRYTTLQACKDACALFNKTPQFSTAVTSGSSFACRVFHLTNVALYTSMNMANLVNTHCGHTLGTPTGVCI